MTLTKCYIQVHWYSYTGTCNNLHMSDTDSDESQGTGENYDQEQESSLNILGKRLHDENSDLIRNAAAKKAKLISDWFF